MSVESPGQRTACPGALGIDNYSQISELQGPRYDGFPVLWRYLACTFCFPISLIGFASAYQDWLANVVAWVDARLFADRHKAFCSSLFG